MDPDQRKVLALIGAGSAVFTRGLLADLIAAPDLGAWELRLVDVNPEALGVAVALARRMVAARREEDRIAVHGTLQRSEALRTAHVIVCTVGVGGRAAWLCDWEIAAEAGIHQAVGDSVMPGGISRALRTIPVMVDIARDAADLAPDALVFNYSNPMTSSVQAMSRYHEVAGLCHGLRDTHRELADMVGAPLAETSILYCGLNHLTWIYDFRWNGRDAWPLLREKLAAERTRQPFSSELFEVHGAYPAPGDRHVTEFFPERFSRAGSYHGTTLGVDAFSLPEVLAWGEQRYAEMRREANGEQPLDPQVLRRSSGDQEELIDILRSIMFDTRRISSVNAPNTGFVPNLPAGAVLEVPAVATARGLRPLTVPDFPNSLAAIVERRLASVALTIEAALLGDRDLAVQAMLADGAVNDPNVARTLLDRYLSVHAEHLPAFAAA